MYTAHGIKTPKQLIDKTFFANALQNGLREQRIEVKQIVYTLGNESSDSSCSSSFRFYLIYSKPGEIDPEGIYVILRAFPKTFGETDAKLSFNLVKWMGEEIIPQLEIMFNDVKFSPICYYTSQVPLPGAVFEDLGRFGYEMAHREYGLDEDHAKMVLKKLGQFHAASMVYAKKRPSMMNKFQTRSLVGRTFINQWTWFYKALYKNYGYQIELISKCEGFGQITEKLRAYHKNFEARILGCLKPRDGEIKVLNHGQLDLDNFLCKYDPPYNLIEVVFLEFSHSWYGSPGIDLNFLFFTSFQLAVLKKWELMLEVYHASLCYTLMELGYDEDIPTYEAIEEEFEANLPYGVFALLGMAPMTNLDNKISDLNNFEKLAASQENTDEIFMADNMIERLKYSLLLFDRKGALDE